MSAVDLYDKPSNNFSDLVNDSIALIQATQLRHAGAWTQANSLGAEDVVVTHLLHMAGALKTSDTSVFVLDTQRLHAQTLSLIAALEHRYAISVRVFQPQVEQVLALVKRVADNGIYESKAHRLDCCNVRKMQPLTHALAGQVGWITGLRREQSNTRSVASSLEQETTRLKLNPILDWTWGDVWHFIAQHQLAYNPLHDAFFPSIGCEPCTRAISVGEDSRAGRWWWESSDSHMPAKECGLHVQAATPLVAATTPTEQST